jgi:hypothetical protein
MSTQPTTTDDRDRPVIHLTNPPPAPPPASADDRRDRPTIRLR